MTHSKTSIGILLVLIAVFVYGLFVFDIGRRQPVTNYVSCVASGNPIMETYPEQCIDNGVTYTRQIPVSQTEDEIIVSEPLSGTIISSPLSIKGVARGNWYFEASFPVQILDNKGSVIGESYVQAKDNWMTEDFVPFEGVISFGTTTATSGVLRLKNDNPSGMSEKDKHIDITVVFKNASVLGVSTTTLPASR